MVAVLGACPMISTLPGPGSKRLLGPVPSLTALVPWLRIQGSPQNRGIGKTRGEVDRTGEPWQRLGGGGHVPSRPKLAWPREAGQLH